MSALMKLIHGVWMKCSVSPGYWRGAIFESILKKGNLSSCDNWYGVL